MLPFPSPEKVPTRMYEGIARRVWTILAHCAERRQQGSLIHRSAWNRNSANFAFWAFSEVQLPLYGVLRSWLGEAIWCSGELLGCHRWVSTTQRFKRGERGRAPRIRLHRQALSPPAARPPGGAPDAHALVAP